MSFAYSNVLDFSFKPNRIAWVEEDGSNRADLIGGKPDAEFEMRNSLNLKLFGTLAITEKSIPDILETLGESDPRFSDKNLKSLILMDVIDAAFNDMAGIHKKYGNTEKYKACVDSFLNDCLYLAKFRSEGIDFPAFQKRMAESFASGVLSKEVFLKKLEDIEKNPNFYEEHKESLPILIALIPDEREREVLLTWVKEQNRDGTRLKVQELLAQIDKPGN